MDLGNTVMLRRDPHRLRYRVAAINEVPKKALATQTEAFKQTGPHRLILITCSATFIGTGAAMTATLSLSPNLSGWLARGTAA